MLRIPAVKGAKRPPMQGGGFDDTTNALYDLAADLGQTDPVNDAAVEARLVSAIAAEMRRHEAPAELYARLDLACAA